MFSALGSVGRSMDRNLALSGTAKLIQLARRANLAGHGTLARAMNWSADALWSAAGNGYWNSTNPKRKTLEGWRPRRATINEALSYDLPSLVAQLRQLDRSTPVARGAVEGRKAELVGTGIGIEPNTGDKGLDRALRDIHNEQAGVAGALGESLWELQRIASGEIDCGGSVLWRGLVLPDRADDGLVPWCILSVPREWFADQPVVPLPDGHQFVAGVEADSIGRGVAAHLKNPDDPRAPGERVLLNREAKLIFERRWSLQATGAPRLDTLVERILQDDEIVTNEMKASRVAGALSLLVFDDELRQLYMDGKLPENFLDIDGGTVSFLNNDSKLQGFNNERPSPNTREWRGTVRGDLAGGAGISRVWLDRDGQAYNFANSKFDQIRTQMMVKPAQDWFGAAVASWPYRQSLPYYMILAGYRWPSSKVEQRRLSRHRLVPDIPPELDEKAAAQAFEQGNRAGIASRRSHLERRGADADQVAKEIDAEAREDAIKAATRIAEAQSLCDKLNANDKAGNLKLHWSHIVTLPGAKTAPGAYLQAAAPQDEGSPNAPA